MKKRRKTLLKSVLSFMLVMALVIGLLPVPQFTMKVHAEDLVTKTYSLSTYVRADDMLSFSLTDPDDNTSKTVFTADGDNYTHTIRKFGSSIQVSNGLSYDDSPNVRFWVLPNVNGKVTKIEFTKACRVAGQVIVGDHDAWPPTWEDTSFFMSIDGMKYNGTDEALTGESHLDERGNTTESESFTFISTDPEGIEGNLSLWLGKMSMFTMLSGCEIKITYIPATEPAHEHNFTYSKNGNTLTATCGHSDGRSCSLADSNYQISVSLEAEDAYYQFGYVYPATLLNNSLFASETGATIGNITYKNNTTWENLGTQKPTGSGEHPTGAGDYTASVTINVGGTTYTLTKDYSLSNFYSINNSYPQFSVGTEQYSVTNRAAENETVKLTFAPQYGETISSLSVKGETTDYSLGNGITKVDDTHYTFSMPGEEVTISAVFDKYKIKIDDSIQHGSVTASIGTTENVTIAQVGDTVTLNVTPETGYELAGLTVTKTGDRETKVEVSNNTFTMPAYNVTVKAVFELIPHTHRFIYSTNGTTITATCLDDDCTLINNKATITIAAPESLIYDGTAKEATITGDTDVLGIPEIIYKKGTETLDSAPAGIGTYTASISLGTGLDARGASVTYTIAKERVTPTVTLSESLFTYDGTEKKPAVIVKIGDTPLAETDYTVSYSNNINAGENTASVLVKPAVGGNYIFDDKEINFSIAKADASITIGTSSYSKTYGDVAFTLEDITTTPADASLTYTVSDSKNAANMAVENDKVITVDENGKVTIVGAGSAKITVALPESQNYNAAESKTIDVTVAKCADPAVVTTTATQQKGGKSLDLSKLVSGAKGAVSFALKEGHEGGCSLVGNTLTSGTGVGTAVVTVTIADSDNYNGRNTDEITVSIVDKETKSLTVTQEDVTYGGTAVNPSYTVISGATNKSVSYTGTLKKDGSTYSSQTAPTEPGNYSVVVSYETDTEVYTGSTTFKINKATITITGKNKNIYTGETVPNLTNLVSGTDYTVTGLVSGETLIGTVALKYQKDGEDAVPDNTKAGIYQIVPYGVTVPNADNYNDISFVNGTLTITVKQSGGGSSSGGSGGGTSSGGSSSSGGGSSSSGGTSTPDPNETSSANATTTETSTTTEVPTTTEEPATTEAPATTEVKPGDKNTETITNADGSTTVKETVKNDDGSVDQKETTTTTDGTKIEKVVTTSADGTKIEKEIITSADGTKIEKQSTTDSVGNKTTSTAITNKDGSTEKKVEIANVDGTTEKTVEDVKPDGTTFTTSDIKNSNGDTVHEEKTTKPSGDYTSIKETTSKTKHTILVEEKVGNTKQVETYNVTGKKTVALTKATTNANNKIVTIPKTINSNGKTYKVTTLKKGMLKANQSKPKTVKLSAAGITKVEKGAFNGMAKKGTIKVSGTAKQVKKLKKMLKKSGLPKGVKIKRVK